MYYFCINCTSRDSTVDTVASNIIICINQYGGDYLISIDLLSRTPVYEQITTQIEDYVLRGILSPGDKIPSVRSLSISLSINPNTIQKAYSELDRKGITSSVPGRGSFVSENAIKILKSNNRNKLDELSKLLDNLKLAGVSKEEIISYVNEIFESD